MAPRSTRRRVASRRGRQRHLPQADGRKATCPPTSWSRCATSTTAARAARSTCCSRELPDFTAVPGTAAGPQHRGTIHISPTMDYIERAYDDAKYGRPSRASDHRGHDPVGAGRHAGAAGPARDVDVHPVLPLQAGAGAVAGGGEREVRRPLLRPHERVRARTSSARSSPGRCCRRSTWSSASGSPAATSCRASMSLSSLSFMRPVPGYADYRTPVRGPVPVRGGDAPGRRRHGRLRVQRGAGDPERDMHRRGKVTEARGLSA